MPHIKDFEPFRAIDPKVLDEVVREGEERLQAQLAIAASADQRALTIAGFQIASASAALAGAGALLVSEKSYVFLEAIAIFFSVGMLAATAIAIHTVRPQLFHIPGNNPKGWLPENWIGHGSQPADFCQARIEQAFNLEGSICDNKDCASRNAKKIRRSLDLTLIVVGMTAALLAIAIGYDAGAKSPSKKSDATSRVLDPAIQPVSIVVNASAGPSSSSHSCVARAEKLRPNGRMSQDDGGRGPQLCPSSSVGQDNARFSYGNSPTAN